MQHINRNLNQTIKRVLITIGKEQSSIGCFRRIEDIADDDKIIVRNRTDQLGLKADYFTISDKFQKKGIPLMMRSK